MDGKEKKSLNLNIDTSAVKETLLNFVVPLVCLVVSILLLVLVIYPSINNIPELKSTLSQREEKKQVLQTKVSFLKNLTNYKSAVDENSNLINRVLVSEADVPKLLDQIHQIAVGAGLTVTRLSYSYGGSGEDQGTTDYYDIVNVSLGAQGSYSQLALFLQNLEKAARLLNVDIFRFSRGSSAEDINVLSISLSIQSPYLFVQSDAVTDDPVSLDISNADFVNFINKLKEFKFYEFSNQDIKVIKEAKESTASMSDETLESSASN